MGIYEQILMSDVFFSLLLLFWTVHEKSCQPRNHVGLWTVGAFETNKLIIKIITVRNCTQLTSRVQVPVNGCAAAPEAVCIFEELARQHGIPAGMKMKKNMMVNSKNKSDEE